MYLTQDMLNDRLQRCLWATRKTGMPIGLHAMPRCRSRRFAGVGFVNPNGSDDPKPLFDVYVGVDGRLYSYINAMVKIACDRIGQEFVDMA